ncbi:MAG: CoA transferase [Chloroflexi bacterium]|nr:CoA transferase [Chloroflexota bacterium]
MRYRGPLNGIRVLELGQWVLAPYACRLMAEMGAEVIKIENHATGGDPSRGVLGAGMYAQADFNYYFDLYNRGKKSLALDVRSSKGRQVLGELARVSDVFVTNLRPGALKRLKTTYGDIRRYNRGIVYVAGSGWGHRGPDANRAAYAVVAWMRSGLASVSGKPGESPLEPPLGALDHIAGLQAALGAVLALLERQTSGRGRKVNVSLLGAAVAVGGQHYQETLAVGRELPPRNRDSVVNPLVNFYRTRDGRWIYMQGLQTDRYWAELCDALGLREMRDEDRFRSHELRLQYSGLITEMLDKVFSTLTWSECEKKLAAVDIPWTRVNTISEAIDDVQMKANEYLVAADLAQLGQMKSIGATILLDGSSSRALAVSPALGKDTNRVLKRLLNYSPKEIQRLREENVVL